MRRLLTDFRRGDLFGRCRYPRAWKKSHRFHRYTQIFLGTFFKVTQISQMTQIFFIHRMTRNLFGDFLRRQLLTDFHGGDLSGRCRYPLELEYVPQRKICVYLRNLWDKIIPTKKNLRHLRNLRDKNNRSIYRARAIGQRPKFRENP